jgi:hypothetical protein
MYDDQRCMVIAVPIEMFRLDGPRCPTDAAQQTTWKMKKR